MLALQMPFPRHDLFDLVDAFAHAPPRCHSSELRETEDAFHLAFEAPGVLPSDVDITLDEGVLRVRGESKVERSGLNYCGKIHRAVALPAERIDPEKVQATLEHGLLHVTVRTRARAEPIKVQVATSQPAAEEKADGATAAEDDAMGDDQ